MTSQPRSCYTCQHNQICFLALSVANLINRGGFLNEGSDPDRPQVAHIFHAIGEVCLEHKPRISQKVTIATK